MDINLSPIDGEEKDQPAKQKKRDIPTFLPLTLKEQVS
jgi:hypothetical protein